MIIEKLKPLYQNENEEILECYYLRVNRLRLLKTLENHCQTESRSRRSLLTFDKIEFWYK